MKSRLAKYVITCHSTVYEALKKIDSNKSGFVIVIDEAEHVIATLTDGDIRRGFIKGCSVDDKIDSLYVRDFEYLKATNSLSDAIELFKNRSIRFLPVLNADRCLTNVITKSQMHAVLLQDLHADIDYDFCSIDAGIVDYEIFQRPWGFYKTTILNDYFQSKIISVNPKQKLSLQAHKRREEHWIVVHGEGAVQIADSIISVSCGSSLFIPKGAKHRLENTSATESLIITEVQIGDYLGEDDIIRFEDDYGRV